MVEDLGFPCNDKNAEASGETLDSLTLNKERQAFETSHTLHAFPLRQAFGTTHAKLLKGRFVKKEGVFW